MTFWFFSLPDLADDFSADLSTSSLSVGHDTHAGRKDLSCKTTSDWAKLRSASVDSKAWLADSLDRMDHWLAAGVVLKMDANCRKLAFGNQLVRSNEAFLFKDLDNFDFDFAVWNVDGHHSRVHTIPDSGQEVCDRITMHLLTNSTL